MSNDKNPDKSNNLLETAMNVLKKKGMIDAKSEKRVRREFDAKHSRILNNQVDLFKGKNGKQYRKNFKDGLDILDKPDTPQE